MKTDQSEQEIPIMTWNLYMLLQLWLTSYPCKEKKKMYILVP